MEALAAAHAAACMTIGAAVIWTLPIMVGAIAYCSVQDKRRLKRVYGKRWPGAR